MMNENWIKGIVQAMLSRIGVPRWGIVDTVNPNDGTARVLLQPEGVLTGYLPIKSVAAGPGMSVIALPSKGDQVQIHPDCGDMEHGVISLASHSTKVPPPNSPATGKPAQSAEYLVIIGGVYLHITGNTIFSGGATWKHVGDLNITGKVTATGNITAGQGTGDQVTLQNHNHNYQPGSGSTTTTSPPIPGA